MNDLEERNLTSIIAEDNFDENLTVIEIEEDIYTPVPYYQKLQELKLSSINERFERFMLLQIGEAICERLNYNFISINDETRSRQGIKVK